MVNRKYTMVNPESQYEIENHQQNHKNCHNLKGEGRFGEIIATDGAGFSLCVNFHSAGGTLFGFHQF